MLTTAWEHDDGITSRGHKGYRLHRRQAGPACTQLLAWMGADVLKVERPGIGDVTRWQLRDVPNQDALYFTMLNSNKKSLELDTKTPEGKAIIEKLIRGADILVENFAPGAMDRMGLTWEHIQELNPRLMPRSEPSPRCDARPRDPRSSSIRAPGSAPARERRPAGCRKPGL